MKKSVIVAVFMMAAMLQGCGAISRTQDCLYNYRFYNDVSVDYSRTFEEMSAAGKYDSVEEFITAKNFPITPKCGVVTSKFYLVHFNQYITTVDIRQRLTRLGLQPARIEHLFALGEMYAKYPASEGRRGHLVKIIALGSRWDMSDKNGYNKKVYVVGRNPPMQTSSSHLSLYLGNPYTEWSDEYFFLAVPAE